MLKNGHTVTSGKATNVLGNPALCVAWLANKLHEYDLSLKQGEIILSGALSAAVAAQPGDLFTAEFSQLGKVSIKFID